eukprot:GGOE01021865.1.p1 GENE.GGOE01021865.1~~GGOE01021865.1.p1  ORF type:complete len:563 (-),score=149.39 GGOE01021865.1:290-1753(-)
MASDGRSKQGGSTTHKMFKNVGHGFFVMGVFLIVGAVAQFLHLNRKSWDAVPTGDYGSAQVTMVSIVDVTVQDAPAMAKPPLQIFGEDEAAFCFLTMEKRMPAIARDVIADNPFLTPSQAAAVEELARELENGGHGICREVERFKTGSTAPWKAAGYERSLFDKFAPYLGKEWRDTPWLHGEIYFYHRILEATGWFEHKKDIFSVPKMKSLNLSEKSMITLTSAVVDDGHVKVADQPAMLDKLIHSCLWGNKVDLCLFKVDDFSDSGVQSKGKDANVMTDNTADIVQHLESLKGKGQVDFILDNFGYELFTDLVLTYFLLEYNWAEKVVLHCKMQPYYVSDALEDDVAFMLDHLIALGAESSKVIGETLKRFHDSGRLQWTSHLYWMAPMEFCDMPEDVRLQLSKSQLVFVKGDLNYRRLVGDRLWPYTTPLPTAVSHFPTAVAALRTNKSEVLVGVDAEALAYAKSKEPGKWLVSGNFGVIQFWKP